MHRNIILSILLVLFVFASASAWAAMPNVGDVAPNVRYQDIDTEEDLWLYDEYAGSIVVLEMFAGY
ncbi:MAG: hypothetical protein JW941_04410 [Candidatus Coatesbacteria bacterium]|nr:hypothetical protein [Candidatus Coatesbacteria bacterium]